MLIGVLLASVREQRRGAAVADWVLAATADRAAGYELIDLREHPLPHFAEPIPPIAGRYQHEPTRAWASVIAGFDGFVVVSAEYNHGIPSALKNALDHLHAEWTGKAVGLVGYGIAGGARAIDQLRVLSGVLGMADVGPQVELTLGRDLTDAGVADDERHRQALTRLLDAVESWTAALAPLRKEAS